MNAYREPSSPPPEHTVESNKVEKVPIFKRKSTFQILGTAALVIPLVGFILMLAIDHNWAGLAATVSIVLISGGIFAFVRANELE